MTFAERAAAVQALGFTPRQAAFLTIVVLNGGYCLRRQYSGDFLDQLVERKFAERIAFRPDRGSIYHVIGRSVYAAIHQDSHRIRRQASPPVIARKVMVLDFVLAHPELDWYATDADKMDLFVNRLGIPPDVLQPQLLGQKRTNVLSTTRYWIQKLPVFVADRAVHFVCLVLDPQASGIEPFVREHAPLLRHLPSWSLHAVSPERVTTDGACNAAYQRALVAASLASVSKADLAWYTSSRELVAAGNLRDLTVSDLNRYRTLTATIGTRLDIRGIGPLVLHPLPHSYSQFGSFAGLS